MWYNIFKFELKYRAKRAETYVFFAFLFLFSIVGVDFVFQGVEIGLMKKNAPLIIAKTMGAISGIFMIVASMIMGVPILRDFQYNIESLLFINPIKKRDYILGKFFGSFAVLLLIFSSIPLGMMVGAKMPWHNVNDMLAFNATTYFQSFVVIVLPILFFGSCLFFVTGMLSRKLLVVYTQGIILFVVFLLTKAITNEYVQAILDPFSLTTLTHISQDWSIAERNSLEISLTNVMLHNKLFWSMLGLIILLIGYRKFSFTIHSKNSKIKKETVVDTVIETSKSDVHVPKITIKQNFKTQCIQLYELSKFYTKSLLKETSFWAISICGVLIILINSVNLGTVYGVDSYPATYFIVEELQEMSLYFFIIVLVFYSGELIWKERAAKLDLIYDATPIQDLTALASKFIALLGVYVVLMLSLIVTGMLFQLANGYYRFELQVYFYGFFLEILPFLILYTFIAFFFQVITNNKYIGMLLVLVFFIVNIGSEFLGFKHSLYKFGGPSLGSYSDMNSYGHFLEPYLWFKGYWGLFGLLILILSSIITVRGIETNLKKRINYIKHRITKPIIYFGVSVAIAFLLIGSYIFYNTNVLNNYWSNSQQTDFRASYEKQLKPFEYKVQPEISSVNLHIELYPKTRGYLVKGHYMLKNTIDRPIKEIHVQKVIAQHVQLDSVIFEGGATVNTKFNEFYYTIYSLTKPLQVGDSIQMNFIQSYNPVGFETHNSNSQVVGNGTFFNNQEFPTLGYNKKYELTDKEIRKEYALSKRNNKANREDQHELLNGQSGGDSNGINYEVIIATDTDQTALTSGALERTWTENERSYFHYKMKKKMINFYSIVSASYKIKKDSWQARSDAFVKPVGLEIYYHPEHSYNLNRMMAAMKASLTYYSSNFSPYQYEQLRIMEFPRYARFAQSFPNTIPFSEALGFVLDIDDEKDVDMAFYVTAHEVAHQWWGMQVEAANVQGRHLILETLSQYSALMVLEKEYSEEKVLQFLEKQQEIYKEGRHKEAIEEPSLALVENQDYVYYAKGAIAMYNLQEHLGEEAVNLALKRFINDWSSHSGTLKSQTNRYATTADLLHYFKEVTPNKLQHLVSDFFEDKGQLEIKR